MNAATNLFSFFIGVGVGLAIGIKLGVGAGVRWARKNMIVTAVKIKLAEEAEDDG